MDTSSLAYVDVETTGSRPGKDRITEVGIVITENHVIVEEWQSLVNPGIHIPVFIQSLTGITPDLLESAPSFDRIASDIRQLLDGRIFIAHNAKFDYGFIRNEFRRMEQDFKSPVACTVKLSRQLYPEQKRHNLDTLLRVHNIECAHRHRALDDARALPLIVSSMLEEKGQQAVDDAIVQQTRSTNLPTHIDQQLVDQLPHTPGVYLFYGENDALLYIGKSINIHNRVLSHFSSANANDRSMRLVDQLRRIDHINTAGELGALLLEAELIKSKQPLFNRKLRRNKSLLSIHWDNTLAAKPDIVDTGSLQMSDMSKLYGLFRSRRQATERLRKIAEQHELCHKLVGLEKGKGACFAHQLGKCRGVCAGKEPELQHRMRMQQALSSIKLETWPYEGRLGVRETNPVTGQQMIHVVDQWRLIASVDNEADLKQLDISASLQPLDMDTYKILVRHIKNVKPDLIQMI